jgi:PAS domain S-box-containing protein
MLNNLFASQAFIPHGHCYLWKPELVSLHVASDALIAIAYYSIPITLIYFVRKREDLPFNWIVLLFGAFIVACGTTHVLEILTLWHPTYWLSGFIKAVTAVVSLYTALALVRLVPKALALPSSTQLEQANKELEREITERKLVEEALRESEERFRNAFDNAAIGKAIVAPDGCFSKVNRSLCEIVGYSEQELLATTFQAITHPYDLNTDLNYAHQLLSGEIRHYQIEKRYFHKQGHIVWILLSSSLVRDAKGQALYYITQIQDITERKRTEAALQQSQKRYRAIVEDQTELITRFQPDGTLTFVNEAYCRYFGRSQSELIGKRYQPVIFPEDLEKIAQLLDSLNLETPVGTIEHRVVLAGEVRWMQWINRVIFDEQGCFVEFQSVGRDISDKKLADEKIQASLREKEVLLAEIHHRVKNNLHIISNLLYLQSKRSEDQKVREILQDSRNRVNSMALIHESLYRVQDFAEINFAEYVQKLSFNLLSIYKVQPDAISFNISEPIDILIKLAQAIPCGLIINELITNALKHGLQNNRDGKVFVTLERCPDEQQLLIVSNSGDTLPADFSLQNPQSMGLKLVVTLVKQLKGALELERGDKTVFRIKFSASV